MLLTMKNGEIACVVGRVISGGSCCGSIVGYQRGTPSSNGAEKSNPAALKSKAAAPGRMTQNCRPAPRRACNTQVHLQHHPRPIHNTIASEVCETVPGKGLY